MKKRVVITTLLSAILFCSMMTLSSASPLADSGPNTNTFNSIGMWLAIIMILMFYIIPLILYMTGMDTMKYVLAVFCGIGLLINLALIPINLLIGEVSGQNAPITMAVIAICAATCVVNIIWYVIAFRSRKALQDS
ncbi:DUF5391 domain-containing protein [Gracilibacillus caseinilyticus]|uniref:DUF5391 domain-containing protein n=1 Tax=Gracilibacillus caseinilyticus TaxID=2932256 RepID=A0ABY4ETM8_9BACI|nr:DUF5391 family protein [Gracilibacillus caseinilyticus]UOQ47238.1 DUF5391 domain-containing protein [Gracilibacillus caseinilyticus]